jgi:hypothetical protein
MKIGLVQPFWFVVGVIAPLGCAASTQDGGFQDGGGPPVGDDSGGPFGDDGSLVGDDAGSFGDDATGPSNDCVKAASDYIYLVSDQNDMYTFYPPTLALNKLGPLNCPGEVTPPTGNNDGVNSMAVDRHAIAWVNFNDGKVFKVDVTKSSLPCTDSGFVPGQAGFTPQLGMGFATVSATNHNETLYVSDNDGIGGAGVPGGGKGLGTLDVTSMTMTPVHGWGTPLTGANAELTGTGDGKLYGFFTPAMTATDPSSLAEITKASAAVSSVQTLSTINNSNGGYAFSFWGGDFWFYTAYDPGTGGNVTTSITHYVTATKTATVVKPNIGYVVVGAGVSTCAPVMPPK